MNGRAQIRMLPDQRRLHMHDGPIDLIVEAYGESSEIQKAYRAATSRFVTILDELCAELRFLRQPARSDSAQPEGHVARRMVDAVRPFASETFITPMAAVAGAVAEEVLAAMVSNANLSRAYVNDGGDIALHLTPGEQFVVGMVELPASRSSPKLLPSMFSTTTIDFAQPIRGIATSGWRGRSFSLGIADAVTVLADTAASADAAATVIANAVDLPEHPQVKRVPARELAPDSDLGERLVTQEVGELETVEIYNALEAGVRVAESLLRLQRIRAAAITLRGEIRVVGTSTSPFLEIPAADRRPVHA